MNSNAYILSICNKVKRNYTINKTIFKELKEFITYFIQTNGNKYTLKDYDINHIPIKNDLNNLIISINYKFIREFEFNAFNRALFSYLNNKGYKLFDGYICKEVKQ